MELENVKYDAFISYRHCELDSFVCKNLHKKLEAYKLPKSLAKRLKTKTKIERVFRDEDELPLSENLSDPITHALRNSDFLIVICTPRLKESKWCLKEIETFLQTHERRNILVVLAEGEPDESFPYELTHEKIKTVDLNGNEVEIERTIEPLAADCRGENNKQRLKNMDEAVVKLCAAVFGVNYDDLKQRHRERKLRKRRIIFSTVFAIVAIFALTCSFFLIKISKQNAEINERFATSMANNALDIYREGSRKDAIYAARSVLTKEYSSKGYNYDALNALSVALDVYVPADTYVQTDMLYCGSFMDEVYISPNGERIVICKQRSNISVYDSDSGEMISSFMHKNEGEDYAHIALDGNSAVAAVGETGTKWVNFETGEEKMLDDQSYANVFASDDGTLFLVTIDGMKAYENGEELWNLDWSQFKINLSEGYEFRSFDFSGDRKELALSINDSMDTYVILLNAQSGQILYAQSIEGSAVDIATDYEYIYLVYEEYAMKNLHIIEIDCVNNDVKMYETPSLVERIEVSDYGLLACSEYSAFFLSFDGEVVSRLEKEAGAIAGIINYDSQKEYFDMKAYEDEGIVPEMFGGSFLIVDSRMNVYALNDMLPYGANLSDYFFGEDNFEEATYSYVNGMFYISNYGTNNFIQKYEKKTNLNYENVPLTQIEYISEELAELPENFDDICSHLENVKPELILGMGTSSDNKYVAVSYDNTEIRIYSKKGTKYTLEKSFYEPGALGTVAFEYDKVYDTYILESKTSCYILDDDLNRFATIDGDLYFGIDKRTGEILLKRRSMSPVVGRKTDVNVCRVPIYSPKQMINLADDEIDGYLPGEKIMDRYQIPEIKTKGLAGRILEKMRIRGN